MLLILLLLTHIICSCTCNSIQSSIFVLYGKYVGVLDKEETDRLALELEFNPCLEICHGRGPFRLDKGTLRSQGPVLVYR